MAEWSPFFLPIGASQFSSGKPPCSCSRPMSFKHNWLLPSLAPLVLESSCDLGLELCLSLDIAMDPRPANQRQWSLVPDLCWCGWEGSTFLPPLGLLTRGQLVATQREAEHRDKERDPVLNTTNSLIQCCLGFSDTGLLKWVWFDFLSLHLKVLVCANYVVSCLWFT